MKKIIMSVFLISLVGLTACSGNSNPFGSDNPLDGQSPEVQNGEAPKGPQVPDEKPIGKDVFVIDGEGFSDHIVLQQNNEREIVLTARSFFDKSQYRMEITNLNAFKGATIESTDGDVAAGQVATIKFKWSPTAKEVFNMVTTYKMDVMVYTTNMKNVYSYTKSFSVFVYREEYTAPEVTNIQKLGTPLKEGQATTFMVDVRDKDGVDLPSDGRPKLMVLPSYSFGTNLAPYISTGTATQDLTDPTLWHFTVTVDLKKAELTDSSINGNFYVAAKSRFDKVSPPLSGMIDVWSNVAAPKTTWPTTLKFKKGANNQYTFIVQDPKSEGILDVQIKSTCATWPGTASCACEPVMEAGKPVEFVKSCSIQWQVPADVTATTWDFEYTGKNLSKNKADTTPTEVNFKSVITLVN